MQLYKICYERAISFLCKARLKRRRSLCGARREEAMTDANSLKSGQNSRCGKASLSRRSFVAASVAGAALPLIAGRGVWAADPENTIRVGFVSPRTGNLRFFGQGDGYLVDECRKALKDGLQIGGKTYKVDLLSRFSIRSRARGTVGEGPDQRQQDRLHAGDVHSRGSESSRRCLRSSGHPLPFDGNAMGGLVFRSRRQTWPAVTVQMDIPL